MTLKITLSGGDPLSLSADAVAIGVALSGKKNDALKKLTQKVGPSVTKAIKRAEFTGKKGQVCEIVTAGKVKPGSVLSIPRLRD